MGDTLCFRKIPPTEAKEHTNMPCTFLAVSQLPLEGFSLNLSTHTLHACPTNGASLIALGGSIIKGCLFKQHCEFMTVPHLPLAGFPKSHSTHISFRQCKFRCYRSTVKGTLLEELYALFALYELPLHRFC